MTDKYLNLLRNDEVLAFCKAKYGDARSDAEIALDDPYYRFFRIIGEVRKAGICVDGATWLDVGCHHGQFLNLVQTCFGCAVVGVDDWNLKDAMPFTSFDYHAVNLADKEWPQVLSGLKARVISALEVIEHMTDTDQFLEGIRSVMPGDGVLILSTPNINSLRNRVMVPFGAYPSSMEFRNIIHHVRLFNLSTLSSLLRDHGFHVQRCVGLNFLPARFLGFGPLRRLSELLATMFPVLCGNLIVIASRSVSGSENA